MPLRSLKISLPSLPLMAAGSGTVTGCVAKHVRLAWLGSENGSCAAGRESAAQARQTQLHGAALVY